MGVSSCKNARNCTAAHLHTLFAGHGQSCQFGLRSVNNCERDGRRSSVPADLGRPSVWFPVGAIARRAGGPRYLSTRARRCRDEATDRFIAKLWQTRGDTGLNGKKSLQLFVRISHWRVGSLIGSV